MKYFLTSSPIDEDTGSFFEKNNFKERFLSSLGEKTDILFVASDPKDYEMTEFYANDMVSRIEKEGVKVNSLTLLMIETKEKLLLFSLSVILLFFLEDIRRHKISSSPPFL